MANKKILFISSNPSQFKGFFRSWLKIFAKKYDIYILIYPYGFKNNSNLAKGIKIWTRELKKKSIIKYAWYLNYYSYKNINQNISSNLNFLRIIKEIDKIDIDIFFTTNLGHYWEKILFKFFHKKKKIGCLLSPPSGMDQFNSFRDFNKSLNLKKFFFDKGKYILKSDNNYLHQLNTDSYKSSNKIPIISFIIEKIIVRTNKLINLFIIPIYLNISRIKINSFEDKLNFNFKDVDEFFCFHQNLVEPIRRMYPNKKIKIFPNFNYKKKTSRNKKWIYLCDNENKASLNKLYKILINLNKINKIDKLYIKQHPSWLSKKLSKDFRKKLKDIKISYEILEKSENALFEKVQGIILEPGSSIIEGLNHNLNLKILVIKSNYNITSGAVAQFYKKFNEICWNHDVKNLKIYLKSNVSNYKKIQKYEIKNFDFY